MKRLIYLDSHLTLLRKKVTDAVQFSVFTPTRSAARALGKQPRSLVTEAKGILLKQGWAVAPPLDAQRALRRVIQDVLNPADIDGTARTWMPTVQALLRSAPSLNPSGKSLSARAHRLIQVAQLYQSDLRRQQLIDQKEILWRALESSFDRQAVLIYGYFNPQPDELAFINEIAGEGSIFVLPIANTDLFKEPQQAIAWLQQQGWEVTTAETVAETPGEELAECFSGSSQDVASVSSVYAYSTIEAEARGTLAQVKQRLLEGVSPRDIAVIARDETAYGPKLLDVAWEYDVPLRALYTTPLTTTRLGAWITLLLEVIEQQFPFEATAKLLSHPLCTNPDAEFWSLIRSRHPTGFTAWQEICQTALSIDLSVLRLGNRARRDTWVDRWKDILKAFNLRQRCSRWPRESLALQALDQALVDLAKPETEILTEPAFTQELRELLAMIGVPAQPGRGGVELHSPSSVMGAQYRYLFIIGMAEGVLPAPVREDLVLDFYERKALGEARIELESAAVAGRREAITFYHLLRTTTEQIVFSYAKLNGRQEQLPSSYLAQLGLQATAPPQQAIASLEELRQVYLRQAVQPEDQILQQATHAWTVERHRESRESHNEYDGIVGIPLDYHDRIFSVSQLTKLGLCPFQWFAAKVLKLGEPQEAEEDLSPSLRGSLYHRVLELVFKANQSNPQQPLTDPELLQATFQEVEQAMRLTDFPLWSIRREEHLKVLSRVLQHPDFFPSGSEAIALETEFTGEWYGLKLQGRVDRIDRTANGLVLIDYKTGSSPPAGVSNAEGKASLDIQLAIYRAVAAPALFPDESVAAAYYYSLTKAAPINRTLPAEEELAWIADRCKSYLTQGRFPVQPDQGKKACDYCAFDTVCRQGSRLDRKQRGGEQDHGTD